MDGLSFITKLLVTQNITRKRKWLIIKKSAK